jgi:hypothetical protein
VALTGRPIAIRWMYTSLTSTSRSIEDGSTMVHSPVRVNAPAADDGEMYSPFCADRWTTTRQTAPESCAGRGTTR